MEIQDSIQKSFLTSINYSIILNKFYYNMDHSNMTQPEFYDTECDYYLTYGANPFFEPGGGSAGAINDIDTTFFNDPEVIHNDSDLEYGIIKYSEGTLSERSFKHVKGVYHILGNNWTYDNDDVAQAMSLPIVFQYYDVVINHLLAQNNCPDKCKVLHLTKVPGDIYGGNDTTYVGMLLAINKNIEKCYENNIILQLDISKKLFMDLMTNIQSHPYYYIFTTVVDNIEFPNIQKMIQLLEK